MSANQTTYRCEGCGREEAELHKVGDKFVCPECSQTTTYTAYIGVKRYDGSANHLKKTHSWRLVRSDGTILADGEGCLSRASAIAAASKLAREEFGLDV